jgi:hypothetical protein
MSDLRSLLEQADPTKREGELSDRAVLAMRRRITAARPRTQQRGRRLSLIFGLTLVVLGVLTFGLARRQLSTQADLNDSDRALPAVPGPTVRTVQFVAPGGTRVFWTFHP